MAVKLQSWTEWMVKQAGCPPRAAHITPSRTIVEEYPARAVAAAALFLLLPWSAQAPLTLL